MRSSSLRRGLSHQVLLSGSTKLRSTNMKIPAKWISGITIVSLAVLLCITVGLPVVQGGSADHVRWDIINFNPATTPATASAGGVAFAAARNPSTLTIKLT